MTLSHYCHYAIIEVHSAKRTVDDFAVKGIGLDSVNHTDNASVEEYERPSGAVGNGEDSTENEEPNIDSEQEIVNLSHHIEHFLSFTIIIIAHYKEFVKAIFWTVRNLRGFVQTAQFHHHIWYQFHYPRKLLHIFH